MKLSAMAEEKKCEENEFLKWDCAGNGLNVSAASQSQINLRLNISYFQELQRAMEYNTTEEKSR